MTSCFKGKVKELNVHHEKRFRNFKALVTSFMINHEIVFY